MWQKTIEDQTGRLRSGWRFCLAAIAMLVVQLIARAVASLFAEPAGNILLFQAIFRPVSLVMLVCVYGVMVKIADLSEEGSLEGQGFRLHPRWWKELMVGVLLGMVLICVAVLLIKALGQYHGEVLDPVSASALFLVLWITLTAAALEEVAFRGYPFQRLVEAVGPWRATAILSALFGVLHLWNPEASILGFMNTVLVGIVLSIAYLRTRALWLPIGIHFAWNFALGTVFGLPVSGLGLLSVATKGRVEGPLWLTGGSYGIEASLTGAAALFIGMAGVYLVTRPKNENIV